MKKIYFLLLLVFVFFGCETGAKDENKSYLIVDQDSNKVLNRYEYEPEGQTLLKTESYNQKQLVKKSVEYEYDSSGNIVKTIETAIGTATKEITYNTETFNDAAGRLIKSVRTSSEGDVVETFFGYDETGSLRGVVEQVNKGAVIMKDYKDY